MRQISRQLLIVCCVDVREGASEKGTQSCLAIAMPVVWTINDLEILMAEMAHQSTKSDRSLRHDTIRPLT